MANYSKLKQNKNAILLGTILALIAISIIVALKIYLAEADTKKVFGGFWSLAALGQLVIWIRTKSVGYLVWMFVCMALAISYLTDYKGVYIFVPMAGLIITYLYFLVTKRMKWRYRDILELAAKPIEETAAGFTARPFPAGVSDYTGEDMINFGKYLSKNLIAFPLIEQKKISLMINDSGSPFFHKPNINKNTFVAFDLAGNVSVNIARNDYQKYKDELTFDQLCASLGNLFKTFLKLYQNGEQERIIQMIDKHVYHTSNANGLEDVISLKKDSPGEINHIID